MPSNEAVSLDRLNVIGWIKTQLAVIQATFTPALLVFVLQLGQLIPCISGRRKEFIVEGDYLKQSSSIQHIVT